MWFRLRGEVSRVEVIATGRSIREVQRLIDAYGPARWRKLKGICDVELPDGEVVQAELHWYEAHGRGRREMKIKRVLSWPKT